MNIYDRIAALADYGVEHQLIQGEDRVYIINSLLSALELSDFDPQGEVCPKELEALLADILDDAAERGIIGSSVTERDLLDTKLMGILSPRPSQVIAKFNELYTVSPKTATDWYYKFSGDTDYIRRYRVKKDLRWVTETEYGALDITINLSKPEKDPKAIAAARLAKQSGYPKCQLCCEAEGYAGRLDYPARQNHRIIPMKLRGEDWFLQYSPYVYYNEHCIALNKEHVPMRISRESFERLLDFVTIFPHYFIGSNADLPIVGGSILSHDHFQGGCYEFPMERAESEISVTLRGFEEVQASIVKWPLSVLRLRCRDKLRLTDAAERVLNAWRGYSDEEAMIFAETEGEKHNTITPIARRRGEDFELDLVLRNNLTTAEHPLGLYHPHAELHHIKKENIGLIEVMGLAVLPARLKTELKMLEKAILEGTDLRADPITAKHADWACELMAKYSFTVENTEEILRCEVGHVFKQVLEHAGVFKCDAQGRRAFMKFIESI